MYNIEASVSEYKHKRKENLIGTTLAEIEDADITTVILHQRRKFLVPKNVLHKNRILLLTSLNTSTKLTLFLLRKSLKFKLSNILLIHIVNYLMYSLSVLVLEVFQ